MLYGGADTLSLITGLGGLALLRLHGRVSGPTFLTLSELAARPSTSSGMLC